MSGGWRGSDRRDELPEDWEWRREQVRIRAGGRCERIIHPRRGGFFRCTAPGTDCDHIRRGGEHDFWNLEWLCTRHHSAKSSQEGNDARAVIRAQGTRPPEQHPGFIRRNP